MDKVTVKVMSHSCNMADITDQGISCEHKLYFYFCCLFLLFTFLGMIRMPYRRE